MFCFPNARSCDETLENGLFQFLSYLRAYLRIITEKTNGQIPLRAPLGKENIQANKEVLKRSYRTSKLLLKLFVII